MIAQPVRVWRPPTTIVQDAMRDRAARWVQLSKDSASAATIGPDDLVRAAPPWFVDPQAHEPLDLFVAEALDALARESPRKCLAAQMSDSMWDDARASVLDGRLNVEAFKAMLAEWSLYERRESSDRIVWLPRGSLDATDQQADRRAMADLADTALRQKVLGLRAVAAYHAHLGAPPTQLAYYWERTLRAAPAIRSFEGDASHAFYSLVGSVPDGFWRRLESGSVASAGEIGVATRLEELLDEDQMPVQSNGIVPDVYRHPRELFPNGSTVGVPLAVARSQRQMIGFVSTNGDQVMQWSEGAPYFARLKVVQEPGGGPRLSMTREQFEDSLTDMRFQLGTKQTTIVGIVLPNGIFESASFSDPLVTTTATLRYSDLPSDAKDRVWNRLVEIANRPSKP